VRRKSPDIRFRAFLSIRGSPMDGTGPTITMPRGGRGRGTGAGGGGTYEASALGGHGLLSRAFSYGCLQDKMEG